MAKKKPKQEEIDKQIEHQEEKILDHAPSADFTIVGIGASAGGLNALKEFFKNIKEDSGLAFVVVVHLSPEHKSLLSELLQPHCKIPVQQVTKTVKIEPNNVYVIPPAANLNTIDTHLRLSEMEEKRIKRAPIDHFFRTLAKTHDGNSMGLILTGTGSDGALGIKEIKARNGIIIVQDPNDAEFDGMPQSAIATGAVDKILPLKHIAKEVLKSAKTTPKIQHTKAINDLNEDEQIVLQKIFTQIRSHTNRDFSRYKISTIMRRLQRRMQLFHVEKLSDYLNLLRKEPEEVKKLAEDFLITVTNFFRDKEVYEYLEKEVIPGLFANKDADQQVRVWSVGCATGEEAYSITMLLLEAAKNKFPTPSIQVFASDLHERSLGMAREGFYPGDVEVDVDEQRLRQFFHKEDGGYRIKKEVREHVIFTPHNLLSDPPFSKLDLVICRNLLIYLKRNVQKDVFDLFHYSLNKDGILALGTSEAVESSALYKTLSKEYSIYKKINVAAPEPKLPVFPMTNVRPKLPATEAGVTMPTSYGMLHQQLVEQYAPPSILISQENQVLHISQNAGKYLSHPGGEPTQNLFKIIKEELRTEIRSLLHEARDNRSIVHSKPSLIKIDGKMKSVVLSIKVSHFQDNQFALLIFEEQFDINTASQDEKEVTKKFNKDTSLADLETELEVTHQRLQSIIEEHETTQEEMKASNEELQSANEELRSTMEELETSKEELQSMNEELTTVNQENRHRVEELSQLSSDLQNLMAATDIATLFLNTEFRILRFTPRVGEIFNVRPADHGRPITDLTSKLGYENLITDCKKVLDRLIPVEREIKDNNGLWYLTRILPYRSTDNRIEGVVITFVDITSRKQAEESLRKSEEELRALIEASASMVWTTNAKGEAIEDSPSWREYTGQTYNEWKGLGRFKAIHLEDRKFVEKVWLESIKEAIPVNIEFRIYHASGAYRWTNMRAVPLHNEDDSIRGWIGMNIDIHDRKSAEQALLESEHRLKKMINVDAVGILIYNDEGIIIDANETFLKESGYTREDLKIKKLSWRDITPEEFQKTNEKQLENLQNSGLIGPYEKQYIKKDGSRAWMLFAGASMDDGTFLEYVIDVSDRKKAEEKLKESQKNLISTQSLLNMANLASNLGWGIWDLNSGKTQWDERSRRILGLELDENNIQDFYNHIHPEDQDLVKEHIETSMANNSAFDMEYRVILPDNNIRYIHGTGTFTFNEEGNPLRATGLIRDITKQKILQQHKDDFMRIASHELKTPITIVKGYINLVEEMSANTDEIKLIQKADKQIDRISHLINDLLDVSKMEAGKMEFQSVKIDFDQLVKDVLDEMQNISSHTLTLSGETGKKIVGDYDRISQVLINLISNAVKYSPKADKVEIKIYEKGSEVAVDVIDYGFGMDKEEVDKIFDRFYRVKKMGHKLKGLGLGLYISSEIIQRHNGKIWVQSEEGKGSTFSFSLPAVG